MSVTSPSGSFGDARSWDMALKQSLGSTKEDRIKPQIIHPDPPYQLQQKPWPGPLNFASVETL